MTLHTSHFFHLFPHYEGHPELTGAVMEKTRMYADPTGQHSSLPKDTPVLACYIYWSKLVRDAIAYPRENNIEDAGGT